MKIIRPGYTAPVEENGEHGTYDAIESAMQQHNWEALPGEKYWGVHIADGMYTVYEYGEVPAAPSLDQLKTQLRMEKLEQVRQACECRITAGMDVVFADGRKEHFSLESYDQTNIDELFSAVMLGAPAYPYHADGESCKMYKAEDIVSLYITKQGYVTQQTTYYNALRQWILREESLEVLKGIFYGAELPEDLKAEVDKILQMVREQTTTMKVRACALTQ